MGLALAIALESAGGVSWTSLALVGGPQTLVLEGSTEAQFRNRLVTPTDQRKKEGKTATKMRCSLCGLSVFGVKRELKETAWRTVFQLKIPFLSHVHLVVCGFKAVLFALCYNLCKACSSLLVPPLLAPPAHPPFFPLTLWQWSGLQRCLSDHCSTASPKILLILLFQAYNYCQRQSTLLLCAYHGSCGCNIQLCVITSCLIFPCWLGKLS